MTQLRVRVKNVTKSYRKYQSELRRFASWFGVNSGKVEQSVVLDDINFDVRTGEALALVGENGAGKSTLLKIITGIIAPTNGQITVTGRVSAILELGLGFNQEMTGRQNVYLSARVMGFREFQIEQMMGGIFDFCELGRYFDEPVRTYSSGMNMRLAFAVATAERPEVLIVDEALSVGDSYFQFKCINRIRGFLERGTTLLLVSHDVGAIKALCERAILLDGGRLIQDGDAAKVTDLYLSLMLKKENELQQRFQVGSSGIKIKTSTAVERNTNIDSTLIAEDVLDSVSMLLTDKDDREVAHVVTGERLNVTIEATFKMTLNDPHVGFGVRNKDGLKIYESNTFCLNQSIGSLHAMTPLRVTFSFDCHLGEGDFALVVGLANGGFNRGNFHEVIYLEQDYKVLKVICSDRDVWTGFFNLQPSIEVQRVT
jgi:lipopolysaccharide transport system ATP-binding protein